ncbi:hypothetical protein DVA86_34530 [Streptomyces armeniacus]|uniref:Uncharacterized protein n=1 Tax=Streptomyces armeniacus TaxID=83291 RepID=A0A345Y1X0_9ACTN|nr:hypothetical protein DVA86_34530 [Streptomyces armeniacus]
MTWPPVAQTGDGNVWVTGACWLYCRREGVRVLWVGSVRTPGTTGDVYACGPCIAELDRIVRVTSQERAGTTGATTCEHRWLEKRNGKTFCGDCTRQLYL